MGPLPSGEAKRYGDKYFTAMMYAKVSNVIAFVIFNSILNIKLNSS